MALLAAACGDDDDAAGIDAASGDPDADVAIDASPPADAGPSADAEPTPVDANDTDAPPPELLDCASQAEPACVELSYCAPVCDSFCDCDCPAEGALGACGCEACAPECFLVSGCAGIGCPDPDDPGVGYISQDPDECAVIDFDCGEPSQPFSDGCGCGCITEDPR
jgi:hypothetical protein